MHETQGEQEDLIRIETVLNLHGTLEVDRNQPIASATLDNPWLL